MALTAGMLTAILILNYILVGVLNIATFWLASKFFKLEDLTLKTAVRAGIAATVINYVISFILNKLFGGALFAGNPTAALGMLALQLVANFAVASLIVWKLQKLETKKALLVGLVWTALITLAAILVGMVLGAILVAAILPEILTNAAAA